MLHKRTFTLSTLCLLVLAACSGGGGAGGGDTTIPTIAPTSTPGSDLTIAVTNGSGSGTYAASSPINVWAAAPASGMAFWAWTGATQYLGDAHAWHTTVSAPAGTAVAITATYTAIPSLAPTTVTVPGTDSGTNANRITTPTSPSVPISVEYVIPAIHPSGVILEFHGSGGRAGDWFSLPEHLLFNGMALARGYGIIGVNSADPDYWDTSSLYPNNLDVSNVATILAYLRAQNVIGADDKVFGIGASDGGAFVSEVGRELAFRATGNVIDGGAALVYAPNQSLATINGASTARVPAIWSLAPNDGTSGVISTNQYGGGVIGIGPGGDAQAHCNAAQLQSSTTLGACDTSVTTNPFPLSDPSLNYYSNPPSPAYPDRFAIVPGVSTTVSESIYAWMKAQGCIGSDSFIAVDPYQSPDFGGPDNFVCGASALQAQFGAADGLTGLQATGVVQEDLVMYGEHEFMADFADNILDFFAAN